MQRLVHMSTDLARQISMMLEDSQKCTGKVNSGSLFPKFGNSVSIIIFEMYKWNICEYIDVVLDLISFPFLFHPSI